MKTKTTAYRRRAVAGTVATLTMFAASAAKADDATDLQTLKQEIEALQQKVAILERNREVDKENADAAAAQAKKETPQISIGQNGIYFRSADTNFGVRLTGLLQEDSRTFFNNHTAPGNDGFLLRRARPILEATVFRDFDVRFEPDFGTGSASTPTSTAANTPVIYDAYINYRYSPDFQIRAGKFKEPVGLELLQADTYLLFNERALPTDLVGNRNLGVMIHGQPWNGFLTYAAGIFNAVGDQQNSFNADFQDNKEYAGRLILQPFKNSNITFAKGLGFGVAGSFGSSSIPNVGALPKGSSYYTDGQQPFFSYLSTVSATGDHYRIDPQAYYYYGPLGILAEYNVSDQRVVSTAAGSPSRSLQNDAWEVTGSWVLTGEDATYTGVTPERPFDPREGRWGAWQIAARYAQLSIDKSAFPTFANPTTSANEARAWSIGLNWWLNRNIRVMSSFSRTTFDGGNSGTISGHPEDVLFTRVQLAF